MADLFNSSDELDTYSIYSRLYNSENNHFRGVPVFHLRRLFTGCRMEFLEHFKAKVWVRFEQTMVR